MLHNWFMAQATPCDLWPGSLPHSGPSVGALGIGVGSYTGPPFCPLLVLPQWVEQPKLLCLVCTTFVLAPVHLLLKLLQLAKQSTLLCLFLLSPVSVCVGPQFVPLLKLHSGSNDPNFCVWFVSLIFTHGNLVLSSVEYHVTKCRQCSLTNTFYLQTYSKKCKDSERCRQVSQIELGE